MFEEGVEVLFKAFEGNPFSHKGNYYTIRPEVPYRGLHLEGDHLGAGARAAAGRIAGSRSELLQRAFDFMAKYGISGMIGGGSAADSVVAQLRHHQHAIAIIAVLSRGHRSSVAGTRMRIRRELRRPDLDQVKQEKEVIPVLRSANVAATARTEWSRRLFGIKSS